MLRRVIAMVCTVVMAVLFSGVSALAGAAGETITIKFWHAKTDPDDQALFQSYENDHPGIKIEQTVFVDDDYKTQARVALAGGETPDVWYMNTASSLAQFVESNGLLDITEYLDAYKWNETYDEASLKWCMVGDKLYGLPWSQYTPWHVVWANKDFFSENNLDFPVTVDDYVALAPELRALGQEPLVFYNKDGWMGAILFGEFALQLAGPEWIDEMNNGTRKWPTDDVARQSLEAMKKLADSDVLLTGYETLRQDTALPVWSNKQSPLMYNGTWFTQNIGSEFDFQVETLRFPRITADATTKGYQNALDWCLGISPSTKYVKESLDFITFAAGAELHRLEGQKGMNLTPIESVNTEVELPYYFKTDPILEQMDKPKTPFFCYAFPAPVVNEFQNQIKLVMADQTTIDEALDAIQKVHDENY